ncbi:SET domain-containing protein 8 [Magnaporthiopsis poae ATCC 64411]|uniref:SET domain-containing protein 8 n=1 Tax=Magnaporthiopsis poae (strain ATCC 64411 / 73-15) TaxID=644358 RepID=A0A0C4DSJ3_MAGP6|nr:SET domain-containing protein 8 [Magnaporthiopsis poae ATCC 64411]
MSQTELPIESLPIWSRFNGVTFDGVRISRIEGKGFGLVSERIFQPPPDERTPNHRILSVPTELVLNAEAVEEYAKEDQRFRELLNAAGGQSLRGDVLLFLLAQLILVWKSEKNTGLSNPWTQYIKYLPRTVPLPTMWTDAERLLLNGTSLETAVQAKLLALEREFDELKEKSSALATWNEVLWEDEPIKLRDWIVLDAWYRSRCMELPRGGSSIVPCIDMINHSRQWTAFYTQTSENGGVDLCLNRDAEIAVDAEITISYGNEKAPAEMLFSYGFVDPEGGPEIVVLPVEVPEDDPLARAKAHIFAESPTIKISRSGDGGVRWECPFAHFLALNEEDGLGIRIVQLTDGGRQMRLFWEDEDVTDSAGDLEAVTASHAHHAVFRLRAVVLVQQQLEVKLGLR